MKKFFVSAVVLLLFLMSFTPGHSHAVSNNEHATHNHSAHNEGRVTENGDVGLFYVPCPEGGKHTMTQHSIGDVIRNGKTYLDNGYVFQCSKCLEVIISQYNPAWGATKLGKYGVEYVSWRLKTGFIMDDPAAVGTNSSLKVAPWTSYIW